MLGKQERDYFRRRAEQEVELARQAVHPAAVAAHYTIANAYLDFAYGAVDACNALGKEFL